MTKTEEAERLVAAGVGEGRVAVAVVAVAPEIPVTLSSVS